MLHLFLGKIIKPPIVYGCVDILVNNAGVSASTPFTEYTEEDFDKVMDLNVKCVFNC